MPVPVPDVWLSDPPRALVIGEGPYAHALSSVLGASSLAPASVIAGLVEPEGGGIPQVLGNLERVILVAGVSQSGADLLQWHRALWQWIEKLSPEGEQHEVAILFVLPGSASTALEESLAFGLGLGTFDPASGHGVARVGDSLESLLAAFSAVHPLDLPPLRARQARDAARSALRKLRRTGDPSAIQEAAREVLAVFSGREYQLDVFCRPPSHRHGNLLRGWLHAIVTEGVTPDLWGKRNQLASWLVE